jgi:Bacterial alpha-L-rhamnosidase 6 hairpin glycosidase domain
MIGTTSFATRREFLSSLMTAAALSKDALGQLARLDFVDGSPQKQPEGTLEFASSDTALAEGFRWAKTQALAYRRDSPAIGPWYEAALPGRNAFCMRDVSHMSIGAQLLGLAPRTRNMLRQFAEHISASKKWCTWWEITGEGKAAPVDYKNDQDFWYDLPANFDVLDACYRQWLWSRDDAYLDDVFLNDYHRTVTDYVKAWDHNHDGLLEHLRGDGHTGIATYDEDLANDVLVGADLIAAQYAAYLSYAAFQQARNEQEAANEFAVKARRLKSLYNSKWWDASRNRYFAALREDGKFQPDLKASTGGTDIQFPLYFGLTDNGAKTQAALDQLEQRLQLDSATLGGMVGGVEGRTYLPDIFYKYGRSRSGYAVLVALMNPALKRREYPEVSYTVVGNLGAGLMGIRPTFNPAEIETYPQLTAETEWAALHHLPAGHNVISIKHTGVGATAFTNESGPEMVWRASLPGKSKTLLVDGRRVPAESATRAGGTVASSYALRVKPGETRVVSVG